MKEYFHLEVDGNALDHIADEDAAWEAYEKVANNGEFEDYACLMKTKVLGEARRGVVRTIRRRKKRTKAEPSKAKK